MRHLAFLVLALLLVLLPAGLMAYKIVVLEYPLGSLIPSLDHKVELSMEVTGHGGDLSVSTYLPVTDPRQTISEEENSSGIFTLGLQNTELNRKATWSAENVEGRHTIRYGYTVHLDGMRYVIPAEMEIPSSYDAELERYLVAEEGMQVDNPLIEEKLRSLFPDKTPTMLEALTTIHRDLQDNFENRDFSGFTDAITALKLGEASCNGKSRLFVALARKLNIPSRLVGGLILNPGSKRTSHQWVEVYVRGHWVPFDTINDHFAEIPANFLTLYYGDLSLFKHTTNINFNYFFKIKNLLTPQKDALSVLKSSALNVMNFYSLFERVGISQNLLKIILMIPLGALITVIFRNIIGLETYGTFLPALIAAAARETGLFWGMVGFVSIILISYLVRLVLDWLQLLHSPKMGVMLTSVVLIMMTITVVGVQVDLFELAHVTLFPIAILAITAERFAIIETEQGFSKAITMMGTTLLVVSACYAVMDSFFLQSLVIAFPELLLVVIALNIWIGKWIGIRVMEFIRFRRLLFRSVP